MIAETEEGIEIHLVASECGKSVNQPKIAKFVWAYESDVCKLIDIEVVKQIQSPHNSFQASFILLFVNYFSLS